MKKALLVIMMVFAMVSYFNCAKCTVEGADCTGGTTNWQAQADGITEDSCTKTAEVLDAANVLLASLSVDTIACTIEWK